MGCAGSTAKGGVDHAGDDSRGGGGGHGPQEEEEEYNPLTQDEVNARIVCSKEPERFTLGKSGVTLRYAYMSQRGYYPEDLYKANQDSFKIIRNFDGKDPKEADQIFMGVFDGHGVDGDSCSYFVRDNIEGELKKQIDKFPTDFERAYKEAFIGVNSRMHEQEFDDSMSGTTAIAAFFHGTQFTIANIGDSRAVVGEKKGKRVIAYSLSIDQTPYRQDERERVKASGAVVMSCDQLEGIVPYHENWGVNLGEELDNGGDPPRVWAPGKSFPGCAFTRSIGDSVAEGIGVTAEPELLKKELTEQDEFVVLASDGVWEFLTNQAVADMVLKFTDPLDACRSVVGEAYRLWLQYEVRTDDITMILAFLDISEAGAGEEGISSMRKRRESRRGSADQISVGIDIVGRAGGENRPVRRGLSKEKKAAMAIVTAEIEDDKNDWVMEVVPKTAEERERIKAAVKANFLFQHLNEAQSKQVYDVMKRVTVKKGDVIIRQGDQGDWFYVVDEGEYSVYLTQGGKEVEIIKYTTNGGNNPCFGELALMYSKPRAATVKADKDGVLWAMDRKSFRSILMKSSSMSLTKTLRSVEVLKSLSVGQLQRLQDLLTEVVYTKGDTVIAQGETSENLYVIAEGRVKITKKETPTSEPKLVMDLGPGAYFGERALLTAEPRAANVEAESATLKVLYISKDAFEEVLGPLQDIIDADRQWREKLAHNKQQTQEKEGLSGVTLSDFVFEGIACSVDPFQYVCTKIKGRDYLVKAVSKAKVVSMGWQQRIMAEKELGDILPNHRMVPLSLTTLQDDTTLYTVFKNRISIDLATLIGETGFDEKTAMFYTASVHLGLEHLQQEPNRVIYRNLTPDAIVLDSTGYVQLLDMRYAAKLEPAPTDFCGYAHYLSPEQVSGQGHGHAADFWALGILTYEMITGGANPWLTGDPGKDSEVGIYQRISMHEANGLKFPEGVVVSTELTIFLNDLLNPLAEARLGERGVGAREVRQATWFEGYNWEKLESGRMEAPHKKQAAAAIDAALKAKAKPTSEPYTGDASVFAGFSTLFGQQ
uniref:protein-serine/threonine phosphatase n=1 Tax=Haptolina brevifila TaxID=156173 RepID=A0A7S2DG28_9EUKA|mmetsp:Transcript_37847/g.75874  ORF Transcript_37847/g.75874 Transcript_37847/m.75874 type:complete len:1049 (+) Transcript_37847:25-3171(+)|eukprot:CAMPEP_0174698744 /NCGR_PEP_ID=MMETSP1094-20130205/4249_1 /TAXON_ID=156173 /ORGANISM="Chrysochromulina brevifilum, Strain UTEX LB 985" /LENGTH=1048 /DNA_ID=CAMNT_0015895971 /DNA_START=25 /DNA_END=3171 /DNA_ORIENTATION=+